MFALDELGTERPCTNYLDPKKGTTANVFFTGQCRVKSKIWLLFYKLKLTITYRKSTDRLEITRHVTCVCFKLPRTKNWLHSRVWITISCSVYNQCENERHRQRLASAPQSPSQ